MTSDKIDTIIGKSSKITGSISSEGTIRVDGIVESENGDTIVSASENLIFGETANIQGNSIGKNITVAGNVIGNIEALESLEILSSARIVGDIKAPRLYIENGASFIGNSIMYNNATPLEKIEKTNRVATVEQPNDYKKKQQNEKTPVKPEESQDTDNQEINYNQNDQNGKDDAADEKENKEKENNKNNKKADGTLNTITISDFQINDKYEIEKCPAGKSPTRSKYRPKKRINLTYFDISECENCTYKSKCLVKEQKKEMVLRVTKKTLENELGKQS